MKCEQLKNKQSVIGGGVLEYILVNLDFAWMVMTI
jgi:hypothetical protein